MASIVVGVSSTEIEFRTSREAEIVVRAVCVDPELRPDLIRREIAYEGPRLVAKFQAKDIRSLRASISSFYNFVGVCQRTLMVASKYSNIPETTEIGKETS